MAEDDSALRSVLERGLRENGYVVDAVADGDWALRFLRTYDYEVAVLDWRMPAVSGLEVVRELRQRGSQVPVLMLTARDAPTDRVAGLDEGADDYLVKPFDFEELLARIRALQRRSPALQSPRLTLGDLEFNPATREVLVDGKDPRAHRDRVVDPRDPHAKGPGGGGAARRGSARLGRGSRRPGLQYHRRPHGSTAGKARVREDADRDGPGNRVQDRAGMRVTESLLLGRASPTPSGWRPSRRCSLRSVYVAVSVIFDVVDSHRLVLEVDGHLRDRLHDVIRTR